MAACDPPEKPCEIFEVRVKFGGRVEAGASVAGIGGQIGAQMGPQGEIILNEDSEMTVSDFEISFDVGLTGPFNSGGGLRCDLLSDCSGFGSSPGPAVAPGSTDVQNGRFNGPPTKIKVQFGLGAELRLNGEAVRQALINRGNRMLWQFPHR